MLSIPASVSKRKQVCISCRQRKKRCDAVRPGCSLCRNLGIQCKYVLAKSGTFEPPAGKQQSPRVLLPALTPKGRDEDVPYSLAPDSRGSPVANFDDMVSQVTNSDSSLDYRMPDSRQDIADADNDMDLLHMTQLPNHETLKELIAIFFNQFYNKLPCFHKQKFIEEVESGYLLKEAPLVLYAICCLTSSRHTHVRIQERQKEWYELAKLSYELTTRSPHQGLRAIQAVLLLVYHATTIGDFSADWLFLGKAWRQAVALGLNRLDVKHPRTGSSHRVASDAGGNIEERDTNENKTVVEKEECRRTLWLLLMLDRGRAWPTASPNAVSELYFKADIPLPETVFQDLNPRSRQSPFENAVFTTNLNNMINSSIENVALNLWYYLAVAHILLGRVAELIHSLHEASHTLAYTNQCNQLDSLIVRFRLSIPRQATSVFEASSTDCQQVIWLNIVLNTMAILLHYRCSTGVPISDASSQFALAVTAARSTAQLIKDVSRISVDLLLSAHFGAPLYMAACVLVIQWNTTRDASLREDIGLFESVFNRMNEVFLFLGLKFKIALEHDLARGEKGSEAMRAKGAQGLLADCSRWTFMNDELKRRGIDIQIS